MLTVVVLPDEQVGDLGHLPYYTQKEAWIYVHLLTEGQILDTCMKSVVNTHTYTLKQISAVFTHAHTLNLLQLSKNHASHM